MGWAQVHIYIYLSVPLSFYIYYLVYYLCFSGCVVIIKSGLSFLADVYFLSLILLRGLN